MRKGAGTEGTGTLGTVRTVPSVPVPSVPAAFRVPEPSGLFRPIPAFFPGTRPEKEAGFLAFFHAHVYNTCYRDEARAAAGLRRKRTFARLFCAKNHFRAKTCLPCFEKREAAFVHFHARIFSRHPAAAGPAVGPVSVMKRAERVKPVNKAERVKGPLLIDKDT